MIIFYSFLSFKNVKVLHFRHCSCQGPAKIPNLAKTMMVWENIIQILWFCKETKKQNIDRTMMHIWGSRHKDWYCLPTIGSSGGILIIWDEMIFNKKEPFWDHTLYPLDFLLTSTASLFSWNNMNALYWLSREKKYLQLN